MNGVDMLDGGDTGVTIAHLGGDGTTAVVLAVVILAGAVIARGSPSPSRSRQRMATLMWVAVAGIAFQVIHFAEHVLQAGYWVVHPGEAPWLTPWAAASRDVLARAADGQATTGNELLHLGGNAVFLAGLIAAVVAVRASHRWDRSPWGLRMALWAQGVHVGLHVGLTVTWLTIQQAHGLSTLFGLLEPGTVWANAMRVWVHFVINLIATVYAVIGLWQIRTILPGLPGRRETAQPAGAGHPDPAPPADGDPTALEAGDPSATDEHPEAADETVTADQR